MVIASGKGFLFNPNKAVRASARVEVGEPAVTQFAFAAAAPLLTT